MTKHFHIGDILSITTGRLVSPRHIAGVNDILNWMSGEDLFTHQLGRVSQEAKPVLLAAHPQLASVDSEEDINPDNLDRWLAEQVALFGEYLSVPKLNVDQHERIDPLSELVERIPTDRIVVVKS